MREIKFRAWDKQEKRLVRRFLPDWGNISQERYLLLQYTGLKDKNGVEIYEGDIVQYSETDTPHTTVVSSVEWDEVYSGFYPFTDNSQHCCLWEVDMRTVEVIGNIYEHPELLEAGDGRA